MVFLQHRQVLCQRKASLFGSLLSFHFDLKLILANIEAFQSNDRADRCVLRGLDMWVEHLAAVHENVAYDWGVRPVSRGLIEGNNKSDATEHRAKDNARRANVYEISALIEENERAALVIVIAKFLCGLRDLATNADMRVECTASSPDEHSRVVVKLLHFEPERVLSVCDPVVDAAGRTGKDRFVFQSSEFVLLGLLLEKQLGNVPTSNEASSRSGMRHAFWLIRLARILRVRSQR